MARSSAPDGINRLFLIDPGAQLAGPEGSIHLLAHQLSAWSKFPWNHFHLLLVSLSVEQASLGSFLPWFAQPEAALVLVATEGRCIELLLLYSSCI